MSGDSRLKWAVRERDHRAGSLADSLPLLSVSIEWGVRRRDESAINQAASEDLSRYRLVRKDDIVLNRMRAFQGALGLAPEDGMVSPDYAVLECGDTVHPAWLAAVMRSAPMIAEMTSRIRGIGGTESAQVRTPRINVHDLLDIRLDVPHIAVQRAIAAFLDRETAQIDAMIEAQRALVERLEERRSAVSAAVLGSAIVDVKPGRLLKHHLRSVRQGWSPQCHPYPRSNGAEWAVLRTGCVNGGRFNPDDNKVLPDDLEPRPDTVVRQGEIVMSRANTRELLGSAAVVASDHPRLMLSDKLYALDALPHANPWFVAGLLGTRRLRDLIEIAATGASQSMQNISQFDIVNLPMELPARDDQDEAVERLAMAQGRIDDLVSAATDAIALMQERRAARISAAVTGRIDPRTGRESAPKMVLESI